MINKILLISKLVHEASQDMAKNTIDNTLLVTARDLINEVFTDIMDDNMTHFITLAREFKECPKEDEEERNSIEEEMGTIAVECEAVSSQVKKNFPKLASLWDNLIAKYKEVKEIEDK